MRHPATPLAYRAPADDRPAAAPVIRAVALVAIAAGLIKLASFSPQFMTWYRNGLEIYTAHWANAVVLYLRFVDAGVSAALVAVGFACLRHRRTNAVHLLTWTVAAWLVLLAANATMLVVQRLRYDLQFPAQAVWRSLVMNLVSGLSEVALIALTPLLMLWLLRAAVPGRHAGDNDRT